MRVVSLNIDLPDLIVVKRAVDAYLDQCPCRQKRVGDRCETCRSLENTRKDLTRLADGPRPRPAMPLPPYPFQPASPPSLVAVGLDAERPRLRVVSRIEARG